MKTYFIILLLAFHSIAYCQPLTLDQSWTLNYSFDFGKQTNGVIINQDKSVFCYGFFSTIPNLSLAHGIKFDSQGNLQQNFFIDLPLNDRVSYAEKTNYGYFLSAGMDGFRKMDEYGNNLETAMLQNWSSTIPSAVLGTSLTSYLYADGRILAGCMGHWPCLTCEYPAVNPVKEFSLYRLLPDGTYDTTFNHTPDCGVNYVNSFDDTSIYVSGFFTSYDNFPISMLARIDPDGNLDTTFQSIFTWGSVYPAYQQPDGKLICTGLFVLQGSLDTLGIVRLHTDGSLDSTFNNAAVISQPTNALGIQASPFAVCPTTDGGYLVGGEFTQYQGVPRGNLVKTDGNGFIDTSVLNSSGVDSAPYPTIGIPPSVAGITYGPDDKYYITGYFNGFDGQSVPPLIRLNGLLTSLDDYPANNLTINLFPNPASKNLQVSFENSIGHEKNQLEIFDSLGSCIFKNDFNGSFLQVDVTTMNSGIYFLKVVNRNMTLTSRFQVMHE